jgi:enamine deaminase RidA (YjgF/YER057c/UK114 family)
VDSLRSSRGLNEERLMKKLPFSMTTAVTLGAGLALGAILHAWLSSSPLVVAQTAGGAGLEARLRELKIELPPVSKPTNTLVNAVRVGDMLYVSGTGPARQNGKPVPGRLGQDLDIDKGRAAAREVGLQMLAVVKAELGSLDKVQRLVKTFGMVNATLDFRSHPEVINGFSDLMVDVFGEEAGKGARSAVGMGSLPGGIPVEIEAIFQVRK